MPRTTGAHRRQARDGEGHTDQIVPDRVAPLDLVIGDVQTVEQHLDRAVGGPQRQQQRPDQGEGQLAGRILGQSLHLAADELGHARRHEAVQEIEPRRGVGRVGEQAVDRHQGRQGRKQRQQDEEGHATGDEADPVAEITGAPAP
jgi:hypothetical protein